MATTSSTTKTKPENPKNLTKSRSLGRKPKPALSSEPEANTDGSDRKAIGKPLPNYLKPTISSRPDPVKFLKKNNALQDNQKLLRRRSFDIPPSSLTASSQKSLNISPRDRPTVPREKSVTGLRSASFHGSSRGGLRGSCTVKSPPVASRGSPGPKKSCLSGSSSSKTKMEGSENVQKKSSGQEITPESSPLASTQEDEEEIVKEETDDQVPDHREEPKEEEKDQVAQSDESGEEKETTPVDASTEEQIEEPEEHENNTEDKEDAEKKVDDEENSETVVTEMKETANVEESKEEAEVKEEESESSKEGTTETKAQVEELPEEGTKKELVQGKKESPTAYNDVIASQMQENSKKSKVLALAGAFQTVIDYETAASK